MNMIIDGIATILEIIIAVITINGMIYGIFHKFIKKPLLDKYNAITTTLKDTNVIANEVRTEIETSIKPFIKSFHNEFTGESGKIIKTQLNNINNALRKEELKNRVLSDSLSTIGSYECDEKGACLWANKAVCDMFGLTLAEFVGNGWLASICEEDRAEAWVNWLDAIKLDIPYESTYSVCNAKTGEKFFCQTHAVAHRDTTGHILGFYGTIRRI